MNRDLIFLHWIQCHQKHHLLNELFTQNWKFCHVLFSVRPVHSHTSKYISPRRVTPGSMSTTPLLLVIDVKPATIHHIWMHANANEMCASCCFCVQFAWGCPCLYDTYAFSMFFSSPNPHLKLTEFLLHIGPQGFWSFSDQFSCAVNIYSERGINNKLCPQRPPVLLLYLHAMASATRGTKSA